MAQMSEGNTCPKLKGTGPSLSPGSFVGELLVMPLWLGPCPENQDDIKLQNRLNLITDTKCSLNYKG